MARALFTAALTVTVLAVQAYFMHPVTSPRTSERLLGNSAIATACGDTLCRCSGDSADCSGNPGGLHYIPKLPSTVRHLKFSHNHLEGIYQGDFFRNVTNLTSVYLNANGMKYINPIAFRNLTQLQLLNMDDNNMNYSSLSAVLTIPTLTNLSLRNCDLGSLPDGFFNNATLPELSALILFNNHIETIHLSTFRRLTGLTHLDIGKNQIRSPKVDIISDLEELEMNSNDLYYFPTTCSKSNTSLFPRLIGLHLGRNRISSVGWACLPNLKVLGLWGNRIKMLPSGAVGMFPSLIELFAVSMNSHITTVEAEAFSSLSLQTLYLQFNQLDFRKDSIDDKCFANCPNLTDLQLSHNFLDISENRFLRLFGNLSRIKNMYLESCSISVLTPRMFSGFLLLERLALDRNKVITIPDGTFDGLNNLAHLKIGNNQIFMVSSTMFNDVTRQRLTSLDLSGNPFTCSCDVLWFRSWYLSNPSLFASVWGSYDCFNVPGVDIASFYLDSQACLLSRGAAVLVIVSVSLVLLVRRRMETGRFQYDLFVSFDSDNLPWVLQHLVPQLEGSRGLRLCLHQRDFIPGRNIVDNIAESVERSKKVLMLFSASFVQSQWCQFELALCLRHVMDYDDALVIVCLDDVPSRDLTTAMIAVLKTTTYIQWVDDDDDAMTSFWGRLDVTLQEICPRRDVIVPME